MPFSMRVSHHHLPCSRGGITSAAAEHKAGETEQQKEQNISTSKLF